MRRAPRIPEQTVVFCESLGSAGRPRFYLPSVEPDSQIGDKGVLRLAAPVRHHDAPSGRLCEVRSGDTLGEGSDLVDLQEEGIAGLAVDGALDPHRVGHSQVVPDNLDAELGGEVRPALKIILIERVFNRNNYKLRL